MMTLLRVWTRVELADQRKAQAEFGTGNDGEVLEREATVDMLCLRKELEGITRSLELEEQRACRWSLSRWRTWKDSCRTEMSCDIKCRYDIQKG